ncbi:MAG: hypothetical protein K2X08_05400 [Chlamydiales bacterium]|nr:hypothetical protein [Chlamydiales bacterium]
MDTEQEEYDESHGFSYQTESSIPLRITVNKVKHELPVNLFGLDVSIQLNEIDKRERSLRKKRKSLSKN